MLQQFTLLDAGIVLILLVYFLIGLGRGFFVSLGNLLGFIAGLFAAFYLTAWVTSQVPASWYLVAGVTTVIICLIVGQWLGFMCGRLLRSISDKTPLRAFERLLGGLLNLVVSALVIVALIVTLKPFGVPFISTALGQSKVAIALENTVPRPLQQTISDFRTQLMTGVELPEITSLMYPQVDAPSQPLQNAALEEASQSVIQVLGAATQCGYTSEGSGFVIADGLVATNAHVVAGVQAPVLQDRTGRTYRGETVYYDSHNDIAFVRSLDTFTQAPLRLGADAPAGASVSFMGYPGGGPFDARPATVQGLGYSRTIDSKTGKESQSRLVYQLAAQVQQGNSGGPVLAEDGTVIAQIFAKSTESSSSGYAIPASVLKDALAEAGGYTQPVDTGRCAA